MLIFLILSVLYLGGWGIMFFSTTFRWTFITWTFFALMTIASVVLTLLSAILGVICRLNFGKGLVGKDLARRFFVVMSLFEKNSKSIQSRLTRDWPIILPTGIMISKRLHSRHMGIPFLLTPVTSSLDTRSHFLLPMGPKISLRLLNVGLPSPKRHYSAM